MSGHQYISNSSNLFEDDDVDDETFLRNSRRIPSNNNPFDEQQLNYQQRIQDVEDRTLASSNRSLGLLRETENVGIATAEELARQREQLEKTNKQLDDINTTLRFSQKHLNGLKSVFGGLKNYIAGQRDTKPTQPLSTTASSSTLGEKLKSPTSSYAQPPVSAGELYDGHPATQLRMDENYFASQRAATGTNFNQQLDKNLDEMAGSLSRLKGLAIDLHTEIDDQNDLIDDITNKVENVDVKIGKQNKDINKLLNK